MVVDPYQVELSDNIRSRIRCTTRDAGCCQAVQATLCIPLWATQSSSQSQKTWQWNLKFSEKEIKETIGIRFPKFRYWKPETCNVWNWIQNWMGRMRNGCTERRNAHCLRHAQWKKQGVPLYFDPLHPIFPVQHQRNVALCRRWKIKRKKYLDCTWPLQNSKDVLFNRMLKSW